MFDEELVPIGRLVNGEPARDELLKQKSIATLLSLLLNSDYIRRPLFCQEYALRAATTLSNKTLSLLLHRPFFFSRFVKTRRVILVRVFDLNPGSASLVRKRILTTVVAAKKGLFVAGEKKNHDDLFKAI